MRPASAPCSRCPAFCISASDRAPRSPAAGRDCRSKPRSQAGPSRLFPWNLTVEKNDPRSPLHPRGKKRKKRKSQPCPIVPRGSLVPKSHVPSGASSWAAPSMARGRCLWPWGQELPLLPAARTSLHQHPGPRRRPCETDAHLHKLLVCVLSHDVNSVPPTPSQLHGRTPQGLGRWGSLHTVLQWGH